MASYTAGSVLLQITPSFLGVQQKIDAEARKWGLSAGRAFLGTYEAALKQARIPTPGPSVADATKAGEAAGKGYGAGFRNGIGSGGPTPNIGPTVSQSTKQGSQSGGAFGNAFRARLQAAVKSLPPVRIDGDFTAAERRLAILRRELDQLSGKRIGVDIDAEAAFREVDRINAELERLNASATDINLRADTTQAMASLKGLREEMRRLAGEDVDIDVNANTGSFATQVRTAIERAQAALPRIEIDADSTPAQIEIQRLRARLEILGNKRIGIDISAADAAAQITRLQERLTRLGESSPDIRVSTDAAAAAAALAAVQAQVDRLNGSNARVDVDSSSINTFSGRLVLLGTLIGSLLPALVPIGGAAIVGIGAIGAASSAAIPAVGALFLGLNGVGDALKAMSDVEKESATTSAAAAQARQQQAQAVSAAARQVESAEASLENTRRQAAQQAESAARRITDAQNGVAAAEKSAAKSAADAARAVQDAQKGLADAEEESAEAIVAANGRIDDARQDAARGAADAARAIGQAIRSQEDAERSLTGAQEDALDAQLALSKARQDEADRQEDLAFRAQKGVLDQRQAVLDLAEAQADLTSAQADPKATEADREQARIRFEEAQLGLEKLKVENQRLAEQQADVAAKGVEGSELVTAAQGRLADATQAVTDAEQARTDAASAVDEARLAAVTAEADGAERIADAEANRLKVQEDGADRIASAQDRLAGAQQGQVEAAETGAARIADAQQAVADAVTSSAQQQSQAAFSIEQSERSLEGARAAAASAAAGSAVAATAAMTNLQQAMDNLSPAGVTFAKFLFGLRDEVSSLQTASAAGLLPGLQTGIEAILPLMPIFRDILGNVGTALGQLATMAGQALAGPTWAPFFEFLRDEAGPLLLDFGKIIGNLATAFLPGLVAAFGPIAGTVLGILEQLTGRFADFLLSAQSSDAFQKFLDYVTTNAPVVADFLGSLGDAFVTIIKSMAPFGPVILGIITGLLNFIAAIPPGVLGAIALAVVGIAGAFAVLGPVINFVVGIVAAISAGVPVMGAVIAALGGPVTLIIAGIIALSAVLISAYQNSTTFRDIVNGAFKAVRDFIVNVVWEQGLKPTFKALVDFWENVIAPAASFLWKNVLKPAFEGISTAVKFAWENVIQPALSALVWYWQNVLAPAAEFLWKYVFKPAFEGIGGIVKAVWETVISPALSALKGFFTDTLGPAIDKGVGDFTTAWAKMKKAAADPINFVIREIYTGGIKKLFDQVAVAVKSDARLPAINEVGYARGGWTGPGSRYQEAGVVHADEFVISKPSRQRFEARFPGILDHINQTGGLPGYAGGGRVQDLLAFARKIQGMGYDVGENKALGDNPRPGAHSAGGYHYKFDNSGAVDVNHGAGTSVAEQKALAQIVPLAAEYGLRTIFMVKDHFNHAHFDVGATGGGGGILDKLGDLASGAFDSIKGALGSAWNNATDALSPFTDLIGKIAGGVGDSPMGKLTGDAARQTFSMATDYVKNAVGSLFGAGGEDSGSSEYVGAKGVEQWRSTALKALDLTGSPSSWVGSLLRRMNQESSGDPRAINLTDSNAKKGIPSKGLMQTIDPTFRTYALPGYNSNIYDPLSNIIASIRYANSRYGSAPKGWDRKGGYALGGLVGADIPSMALGGVVPARSGGTIVRLGEAGRDEAVVDAGLLNRRLLDIERRDIEAERIRRMDLAKAAAQESLSRARTDEDRKLIFSVLDRQMVLAIQAAQAANALASSRYEQQMAAIQAQASAAQAVSTAQVQQVQRETTQTVVEAQANTAAVVVQAQTENTQAQTVGFGQLLQSITLLAGVLREESRGVQNALRQSSMSNYAAVAAATQQQSLLSSQQMADVQRTAADRAQAPTRAGLTVNAYGTREDVLAAKVMERQRQVEALQYP